MHGKTDCSQEPVSQLNIWLYKDIWYSMLDFTLTICASSINTSLAQRTFEECFSRLTIRSAVPPGWEEGEKVISGALVRSGNVFTAIHFDIIC